MADELTLKHYSKNAAKYSVEYNAMEPINLYRLAQVHFKEGGLTLDIGAGTGRDSLKLQSFGFRIKAVEPVLEFSKLCIEKLGSMDVIVDQLPELKKIDNNYADNVFCSTVIQHLPSNELLSSIFRLVEILKDDGVLILSWRNSSADSEREGDRLYSHFTGQQVIDILNSYGCEILHYSHGYTDSTRPTLEFYTIVAKKKSQALVGLARIQAIVNRDRKMSTYKLALLRALCEVAQLESFAVKYEGQNVLIPMERICKFWIVYYWPFANSNIKQLKGDKNLAIYPKLSPYVKKMKDPPTSFLGNSLLLKEETALINLISNTIINMPVHHINDENGKIISYVATETKNHFEGYLSIPDVMWRDFVLYGHWIEQGLLIEWAKWTAELNEGKKGERKVGYYLDLLIGDLDPERDSSVIREIRAIIKKDDMHLISNCIWSGQELTNKNLAIDHMIPFSGNRIEHLWNLLPTDKKINGQKKAKIPTVKLVKKVFPRIQRCWSLYAERHEERFSREIKSGLNLDIREIETDLACDALIERITHQVNIRGMQYWDFDPK